MQKALNLDPDAKSKQFRRLRASPFKGLGCVNFGSFFDAFFMRFCVILEQVFLRFTRLGCVNFGTVFDAFFIRFCVIFEQVFLQITRLD